MTSQKCWTVAYTRPIQYDIVNTEGIFDPSNLALLSGTKDSGSARFVVVDSAVYDLHESAIHQYFLQNALTAKIIRFVAGEENKSLSAYQHVALALDAFPVDRRSEPLIAIGGGVLTDLVGFVASTYRRGIPHIKVPTTLMGYVDAAIGIKTGVNFNHHKNRLGSFEPPLQVILDRHFLTSLPRRHLLNGVAEIIKLAVISDASLFEQLENAGLSSLNACFQNEAGAAILDDSITGILKYLEPNLYEEDLARALDFGHTFSPAFEMKAEGALLHGEAVIIGVVICSALAYLRGWLSLHDFNRILALIHTLGLPVDLQYLCPTLMKNALIERTHHRNGQQNVPLPQGIGHCAFANDLTDNDLAAVCHFLLQET